MQSVDSCRKMQSSFTKATVPSRDRPIVRPTTTRAFVSSCFTITDNICITLIINTFKMSVHEYFRQTGVCESCIYGTHLIMYLGIQSHSL
jgi:hypothetical protein